MALPARLLPVDDDETNREMLARRLVYRGYAVDLAVDGLRALEMLRGSPYDLVLLDSMMSGMSGQQVLHLIRKTWPVSELPVLMVTALVDGAHVATALREGVNDYITRPDDFGSGYSSPEYLQRFPFDSIKIDRSFVAGLTSPRESAQIVRAVARPARPLNMSVVAEGIENREQFEYLKEPGRRYGQGYWFSPPRLTSLKQFLGEWPARRAAETAGCRSAEE